jgi:hypothetical protein
MLQSKINGTQTSFFTKFGGKLSFILSFPFPEPPPLLLHIFSLLVPPPSPPTPKPGPNRVFLCKVTAEDWGVP